MECSLIKKGQLVPVYLFLLANLANGVRIDNYWLCVVSVGLFLGLYYRIEFFRKLMIFIVFIFSVAVITMFFPISMDSKDSIFWDMESWKKITLLALVESFLIFLMFSIRNKFLRETT